MTTNDNDIELFKGETLRITGTLEDDLGNPIDLTDASISGTYTLDNTSYNFTGSINNALLGEFQMIHLTAATTAALPKAKGTYKAFVTFASGDKDVIAQGDFKVL